MYKKQRNKLIIITLWIVVAVMAFIAIGYYVFINPSRDNEYCQSVRKQKNISNEYNCKVTNEYQDGNKTYVDVTFEKPNTNPPDRVMYSIDKNTKQIQ